MNDEISWDDFYKLIWIVFWSAAIIAILASAQIKRLDKIPEPGNSPPIEEVK